MSPGDGSGKDTMSDDTHARPEQTEAKERPAHIPESTTPDVSSRRRFMKIGIGVAVPVVLTVTSRPGWAQNCSGNNTTSKAASLAAGGSCSP